MPKRPLVCRGQPKLFLGDFCGCMWGEIILPQLYRNSKKELRFSELNWVF